LDFDIYDYLFRIQFRFQTFKILEILKFNKPGSMIKVTMVLFGIFGESDHGGARPAKCRAANVGFTEVFQKEALRFKLYAGAFRV
jgi:hypothetical protein